MSQDEVRGVGGPPGQAAPNKSPLSRPHPVQLSSCRPPPLLSSAREPQAPSYLRVPVPVSAILLPMPLHHSFPVSPLKSLHGPHQQGLERLEPCSSPSPDPDTAAHGRPRSVHFLQACRVVCKLPGGLQALLRPASPGPQPQRSARRKDTACTTRPTHPLFPVSH